MNDFLSGIGLLLTNLSKMNVGSVAEWVGSIGSIVAIIFTVRYYNKDNRVDLGMNITQGIIETSDDRTVMSEGLTFSAMNISSVPSSFEFMGIRWKEGRFKTLVIDCLSYLIPSRKRFIEMFKFGMSGLRDKCMNVLLTGPDIMYGPKSNGMMKVGPYDSLEPQRFPKSYLIDNLARMAVEEPYIVNKFLLKKKVTLIATYMRYDGKIHKVEFEFQPNSEKNGYYVQILHSMHRFLKK